MAHWPVPRLRGLHPSMTKFDGALRSGFGPSAPADVLTLTSSKRTFGPATRAGAKDRGAGCGGPWTSQARSRPQRPLPDGANRYYRPIAEVRWLEERSSTADGTSLDNVYVNSSGCVRLPGARQAPLCRKSLDFRKPSHQRPGTNGMDAPTVERFRRLSDHCRTVPALWREKMASTTVPDL